MSFFSTHVSSMGQLLIDYNAISQRVYAGPVTAAMFVGTEGARQWALIDGFEADAHTGSTEAICLIEIRRVFPKENMVEVLEFLQDHPAGVRAQYDADELALRIEAS